MISSMKKDFCRFITVLALVSGLAVSPTLVSAGASADVKAIDALVAEHLKTRDLVGLSVAAASEGRVILSKGYGIRSLADRSQATEDTMFAVGSVTKQFTCACILLLAEDGKLAVTDKVAKYYPGLTRAEDITILDLMNHVSGYPDYYPLDFVDLRMSKPIVVDDAIRMYCRGKLDFEPGTRYSYSNTGYLILGRVVEKVSGEPFGIFLGRRILKPLGLGYTAYEPEVKGPAFAAGYTSFAFGGPEPALPEGKGWVAMAGAIYSTAGDLVKWDLALMGGKVVKPESFKLMTTPRILADGGSSGYGCGLMMSQRGGKTVVAHTGGVAGFRAYNTMVPADGTAVALISNFDASGDASSLFGQVLNTLLPAPEKKKGVPEIAGPPAPETAMMLLRELQAGAVDRSKYSDDFNMYLTDEKIKGASERLGDFGEPTAAALESISERGGMEVTTIHLSFGRRSLRALMYRTPDGKIQQYYLYKD
jgi:D-alanyl-D-alanine carboxypeptidase